MTSLHPEANRPRIRTTVGVPVGRQHAKSIVRSQLERGPFLAAFDAVDGVRDISGDPDRLHLVTICDARLLERFDELRARRSR